MLLSLPANWWAWGLFYIETTALTVVSGFLFLLMPHFLGFFGLAPAALILSAALMIHARLLGRLAWHCGGRQVPRITPYLNSEEMLGEEM